MKQAAFDSLFVPNRRGFIGGIGAGALLALGGCQTLPAFSLEEAVRRLLLASSERAFTRMLQPDGFWDAQVSQSGIANLLGSRGDALGRILTSTLFKERLEDAFADVAFEATDRAAPIVTDAVRVIGIRNAYELVNGDPRAATAFLRGELGGRLLEAMVPEVYDALRIADDPLIGQALNALVGTDIRSAADRLTRNVEDVIWNEIGREEAMIRDNPRLLNDRVLEQAFGRDSTRP